MAGYRKLSRTADQRKALIKPGYRSDSARQNRYYRGKGKRDPQGR